MAKVVLSKAVNVSAPLSAGMSAVAGTAGEESVNFATDINLWIVVTDAGRTFVAVKDGSVYYPDKDLSWHYSEWSLSIYGLKSPFTLRTSGGNLVNPSNAKRIFHDETIIKLSGASGSASASSNLASSSAAVASAPAVGSELNSAPAGFTEVAPIIEWDHKEGDGTSTTSVSLEYNIAGWISTRYITGSIDDTSMSSKPVRIYDEEVVSVATDYYPWGRFVGGEWRSLNRQGGSLKRYNGGWQDVKNSPGSGTSRGFRHNGTTWAKSPKTGRE